jgi:uncharacterized repeat protein (TIGR01451 family)
MVGTGKHGRKRRLLTGIVAAAALTIGIALLPMTAGAVHDINVFELDGNAVDNSGAAPPDDWGTLFPTDTSTTDLGHSFTTDLTGATDNGFGSGLTKDTSDVPNWTSVVSAISPEKDDILHAYAATYVSGGDQLLYFGQDRAPKPQGATSMGFWFFQNAVSPPPSGTGNFTGTHANGDLLVTSDMTTGGSVSVVNIFKWQNGGLVQVANLTDAECGPALTNDIACGKANEDGEITVPWSYPTATVPQNIFFEGGINLTDLFPGQQIPCFSTFLANTRTSPSETADLKDYVVGSIDTCATITIHKDVVGGTSEQDFSYSTTGSGLSGFSLDDDGDNANTLKDTKVFTGLTPGNFSVAEGALPSGWTNNDLVCTSEGPGTSVATSGSDAGRTATITLGLAGNADCTYKNTFTKATPPVSTDIHAGAGASDTAGAAAITSAAIGATVHDKATVGSAGGFGTPTGTVSFTVYMGNTACTGTGTAAGTVALSSGVAHPSSDATVPVGGLSYKAHYNGDANYTEADGPCEPLTATKLDSNTTTDIHNAAHAIITSAAIGSTVHDLATVTGTAAGGIPSGTVDFTVYLTSTDCTGAGTTAGSVALDGSGIAHPSNTAVVPVGGLSYKAHYNGSTTYDASDGACEPLNPVKLDSSTTTDIHNAAHTIVTSAPIGSTVHDLATVTGTAAGGIPTGTVDFTVYLTSTDCTGAGTTAGSVALDGSGIAHPSNTAVVPVGGLSYKAHYNGSTTYNASDGACEPLTPVKLDSSTATDVHNAAHSIITSAAIGSTVHDKATVTGALTTPTGTVSFTVFMGNTTCSGDGTAAGTVALSGGVADPSDTAVVPVGGLSYQAHYIGSATYNESTGPCEPLVGTKLDSQTATDIHLGAGANDTAAATPITSAPIGSTVHDKAAVSGALTTPTGTVSFTVFMGNTTCSGDGVAAGTVALSSGVAHPSNDATVPVGGLSYRAHYNGDSTYNESTGACEPLAPSKLSSATATDVHNAAHSIITSAPIGSTVHDKAAVTGALTTPTGTVSFTVFMGNTTCSGDGTAAGTVALSGGVADPSNTALVPVGGLSYQAHYNGSATYNESTGPCEPLVGTKLDSQTATDVHNAAHSVITHAPIGSTVHDKAAVTGALTTPTGDVSFTVFMGNTTCSGDGTAAGTVALSGGVADPSNTAVVPVGGLSYRAHYNGDSTYNESTGPCEPLAGDKLDSTTATDIHLGSGADDQADAQAITSAPIGSIVHDKATVNGSLTTPTGDVSFTVYLGNTTCSGDGVAAGTVALSGGVAHPSSNATVPVGGLSYRAHYNGSATYNESTGPCEPLSGGKLSSQTATDVHNVDHGVITSAPIGSTVHDKATVTGPLTTPTGQVSFTVYLGNTTCEGEGVAAGTVALVGGVAHPSNTAVVAVGGLSYKAQYGGDDTYESSTGPCEPLAGEKIASQTTTDVHNGQHQTITSAPLGSTVHDKAAVTGALTTPTGDVTFTLYLGNTQCEGDGTAAGTVALNGSGVADPSDEAEVPLGGLSYRAHYNGNDAYLPSTGACEPLASEKGTLTVVKDFVDSAEDATVTLRILEGESTLESGRRADGGSISKILPPGTYTADEISGEGDVDLGLYTSSITCVAGEATLVDQAGTSADVELENGADVTCTITNVHVKPQIAITKTPSPSTLQEPGGNVQFTLLVTNTSSIDPITITSLVDDKFGNLNADCGIPGAKWELAPLAQATCTFTRSVSGTQSTPHTDTVTATGVDDGGNQAEAQASATVRFTAQPPPPPPPSPVIDLAVTKTDAPDPVKLNGQLTYTMVVTNNGPFTATGVTAADPLPEGTSFVSVSTTQGTCANNAGLIQCSLGTMAPGATVTITLVVTATRVGTLTNTVTVVGKEPESNTANNTATATTLVPAPLVPPKPKPKPPVVCYTFTVSSKTLTVGKKGTLVVTVKNKGKPVRGAKVVVKGQGITKTARTGKDGKARITITPRKAGIITIRVPQTIVCGARRIGVVGAFEPPVTG